MFNTGILRIRVQLMTILGSKTSNLNMLYSDVANDNANYKA